MPFTYIKKLIGLDDDIEDFMIGGDAICDSVLDDNVDEQYWLYPRSTKMYQEEPISRPISFNIV